MLHKVPFSPSPAGSLGPDGALEGAAGQTKKSKRVSGSQCFHQSKLFINETSHKTSKSFGSHRTAFVSGGTALGGSRAGTGVSPENKGATDSRETTPPPRDRASPGPPGPVRGVNRGKPSRDRPRHCPSKSRCRRELPYSVPRVLGPGRDRTPTPGVPGNVGNRKHDPVTDTGAISVEEVGKECPVSIAYPAPVGPG